MKSSKNKLIAYCLLCWLIGCFVNPLKAQTNAMINGKVINFFTNDAIPFAGVHWKKSGFGIISDSVGNFSIKKSSFRNDSIIVSYVGYEDVYHVYDPQKDTGSIIIALSVLKKNYGVEVKSKFNKGLRWWKNIVMHKKENNPYLFDNYSCEQYNKLEVDINNLKRESFQTNKILKPFANQNHFYLFF